MRASSLPGTILTDVREREWVVGKPIGAGAFGAIYLGNSSNHFPSELSAVLLLSFCADICTFGLKFFCDP
jgi:hypothetical protein